MRNTILLHFLFLISLTCHAQSPSSQSIKWSISELTDLKADTVQNYNAYFITYQNERIVWVQEKREDTFLIKGTEEDWDNVNVSGRIKYSISVGEQPGTLAIVRHENGIEIMLAFINAAGKQLEYKFKVESFQAI